MSYARSALVGAALSGLLLWSGVAPAAAGDAVMFVSGIGTKCIDIEGAPIENGKNPDGALAIGYKCDVVGNQRFSWNGNGPIKYGRYKGKDFCLAVEGNGEIRVRVCSGLDQQRFQLGKNNVVYTGNTLYMKPAQRKCLDLEGGAGAWWKLGTNQKVLSWSCNNQDNQKWFGSAPKSTGGGAPPQGALKPGQLVSVSSGNMVAAGGGNVIAVGGANIVAAGAGN